MKLTNHSDVPVYTISGTSAARPLPEWLARKRKRSLKHDPEYASRIELLQDFEFEEASQCIRISDDGQWVMSTGMHIARLRYCLYSTTHTSLCADSADHHVQGHTNLKSILTTCLIFPCRSPDILSPSIQRSSSSPPITPSLSTSKPIAQSSSTLLRDVITLHAYLGMVVILNTIGALQRL